MTLTPRFFGRLLCLAVGLAAVGVFLAAPAGAHSDLRSSSPSACETVPALSEVVVELTEEIDPSASWFEVIEDASGHVVATGFIDLQNLDRTSLRVALPDALPTGAYRIEFSTTSALDGDPVEGTIPFHVGNPTADAISTTDCVDMPASDGDGSSTPLIAAGSFVALAAFGAVLVRSRSAA